MHLLGAVLFTVVVLGIASVWLGRSAPPVHTPLPSRMGEGIAVDEGLAAPRVPADAIVAPADGAALALPPGGHLVFVVDDARAIASVRAHAPAIAAIVPDWFRIGAAGCAIEDVGAPLRAALPRHGGLVLPRVANLRGDTWTGPATGELLGDPRRRDCVADALAEAVLAHGAHGINVDLEALAPEDAPGLVAFVARLAARLHPAGVRVTVDVTVADPAYDLARLGAVADAVVVMAYDEHNGATGPGPIASRTWLAAQVDRARALVPRDRLVVALGAYCHDWSDAGTPMQARSVPEALAHAAAVGAVPQASAGDGNLQHAYRDHDGSIHRVWCVDAVAAADALAVLAARGIDRTALWRAGSEDPSWWTMLAARDVAAREAALVHVAAGSTPVAFGTGDVIVRRAAARDGIREVALGDDGAVVAVHWRELPRPDVFERLGGDGRELVLTFDDGPDPTWTPAILDVLAELGAPAVFFAVGDEAEAAPALVRRIADEGHVLANHSFAHPRLGELDPEGVSAQIDRTTRLLEALGGHEVRLWRAPYTALFDPTDAYEVSVQAPAFASGHAYVAASIDPADWDTGDPEAIAAAVVRGVEAGGRVIVLHDGGGDRSATVAALARFVPELRARGHAFVGLDDYLGLAPGTAAPVLAWDRVAAGIGTRVVAELEAAGAGALPWLFAICTALAGARVLALGVFALRRPIEPPAPTGAPVLVTVLVPAYNEGKVIAGTIASLLAGSHPALEILVVDDGSTDDTAAVVAAIAADDPRVRLLRRSNGGKAAAANAGLHAARGEIVVAVDADTLVATDAIAAMVRHFADPTVAAVCGNVEVGNVDGALTTFQAIEYVTSQNFDRRAFAALDCIGVVPGALGAWRRQAVLDAGGYSTDTLVEDADLTLAILRRGGSIRYEARAIGRTEAPEAVASLWKQRFRWTYGTYQCLYKHRAALGHGRVGWIALPSALLFQVVFPIVGPIGDAAMVAAIATGSWAAVLSGYLGFLAMDLVASVLAFRLDRKPLRWLPWLLVARFTYRQLLALVCLRAIAAALVGGRHGWRKLERTGKVVALERSASAHGELSRAA